MNPWTWYCPHCEALIPNKLVQYRACHFHHHDPTTKTWCPGIVEKIEVECAR